MLLAVAVLVSRVAGAQQEDTHSIPAKSRYSLDSFKGKRPLTPIQAKNEACTKEADQRGLDGAARRGFMGECTKPNQVKRETAHITREQNCNRRADGRKLEGEDRRKFIDACMDGGKVIDG